VEASDKFKGTECFVSLETTVVTAERMMLRLPGGSNSYHATSDSTDDVSQKPMSL
jgi:hypothetical protein